MGKFEPVRLWLYGLIVPASLIGVGYGWVTDNMAPLWVGVATALLTVPAAEGARSQVTPVARLDQPQVPPQA
jgi:hypothetical protein